MSDISLLSAASLLKLLRIELNPLQTSDSHSYFHIGNLKKVKTKTTCGYSPHPQI
jgi:hypothetical protein